MTDLIQCSVHGQQNGTFVCNHIVDSMRQGSSPGFLVSSESDKAYPDAWCERCEFLLENNNYEWSDEIEKFSDPQLLCSECYVDARALAERSGRMRIM